jgi:hypothetical protein
MNRASGVEQFCKVERTRGTHLLMTVARQTLEEVEGEEAHFLFGSSGRK